MERLSGVSHDLTVALATTPHTSNDYRTYDLVDETGPVLASPGE
jgi:hypothetical protein